MPGAVVDVRQLVLGAYKKKTDLPFYVFVDVNLPAGDKETYGRWLAEIDQTMADLEKEGYAAPSPANISLLGKRSITLSARRTSGNQEDSLWIKPFVAVQPAVPHPEPDVLQQFSVKA